MEFAHILFLAFAALAVVAAFNVILQRNPIYSAIGLIVVLCSLATLFLTLNAQFISAMQIIVYAGAIMALVLHAEHIERVGELRGFGKAMEHPHTKLGNATRYQRRWPADGNLGSQFLQGIDVG